MKAVLMMNEKKWVLIECALYIISTILYVIFDINLLFFGSIIFSTIISFNKYMKSNDLFYIIKIIILSLIIPNNYFIIFITLLLFILLCIKKNATIKKIIPIILFLVINIIINKVRLINAAFGFLYVLPPFLLYFYFKEYENEIYEMRYKIVDLVEPIFLLELFAIILYVIFNFSLVVEANANDWLVGTFGKNQGNIFLFYISFCLLLFLNRYKKDKNKKNLLFAIISIFIIILTNSVSLTLMFLGSYFIISFFTLKKMKKIVSIFSAALIGILFVLISPDWINNYIIKLTNYDYLYKNVPKIQVYQDTFYYIPKDNFKYFIFGNGIGQYSSRAALTCTGKYVDAYNKLFKPSISQYTNDYILNRYVKYNIIEHYGTLYSPFSSILTLQGEFGLIGVALFIILIVLALKNSGMYSKIMILFFTFSCFIENYLEFQKIIGIVLLIYFIDKKIKNSYVGAKNKNICFCINSLDSGGAERVVSILANYFVSKNDVSIITMTDNNIQYKIDKKVNIIKLVKNKKNIKNKILKKILLIPKTIVRIQKLNKVFRSQRPDIIISFLPEASFMSLIANKGRYKIIISDRNDPNIEYKNKIYNFLMKKLYPKADGFVFQTNDAKEYFNDIIDFSEKPYKIIYNPVSEKFICDRYNGKRKKQIVSVGRLQEQKNFELLINAFSKIEKKYPDYKLVIYGEGNLRKCLEDKVQMLNLENRILLPGVIKNVKEKIYNSSIFVLSSNYEGMPNALIEAMCIGLPVISTNCPCGGPKMLIENNVNGILIDTNNVEQLANSMELLLNDKKFADTLGKNASTIIDKVNPDAVNKEWEKLINKVNNV